MRHVILSLSLSLSLSLIASPAAALQIGDGQYNNTYNNQDLAATQARFNNITTKGAGGGVPVGSIIAWPVATNPEDMENWLECNGQAVNAAMYPELRAVIGANVPDLKGRVLQERDATHAVGTTIEAGLPNITGSYKSGSVFGWGRGIGGSVTGKSAGSLYMEGRSSEGGTYISDAATRNGMTLYFDASRSDPVYGNSSTVQTSAYAVRYLIRALP